MKQLKLIALCIAMILCLAVIASAETPKFTDVPESAWYYSDVMNAVGLGLINGKTTTTYCPDNNLTYAEAMKLAACMHQLAYFGEITLKVGDPWYVEYVEYCEGVGIAKKQYALNSNATRAGYMELFANALPDDNLPVINYVPMGSIPDVPENAGYAAAVYKMYRAGIVGGVDAKRNCNPGANIKRSEVAAILSRMMDETKRVRFDIGTPEKVDPLVITKQPQSVTLEKAEKMIATVAASGGKAPYAYSWELYMDEYWYSVDLLILYMPEAASLVSGQNTDTLVLNFPETDGGIMVRCKVADALGNSVKSDTAMLFIKGEEKEEPKEEDIEYYRTNRDASRGQNPVSPITVTVPQTEYSTSVGNTVFVKPTALGGTVRDGERLNYRWYILENGEWKYHSSSPIMPGDPTYYDPTLIYTGESAGETAMFKCIVKDSEGYTGESQSVTITTNSFALVKELPETTEVAVGDKVTLAVEVAGGKEPYKYEWYFGSFVIPTKNYTATPKFDNSKQVSFTMTGDYLPPSDNVLTSFKCEITDSDGNTLVTSTGIKDVTPKDMPLTVINQPYRMNEPLYGSTVDFKVDIYGGKKPYMYEWYYYTGYRNQTAKIEASTSVRFFGSEIMLTLREDNDKLASKMYCVVTDAAGNTVQSESFLPCEDFLMMNIEEKTETNGSTVIVARMASGTLKKGDRIAILMPAKSGRPDAYFAVATVSKLEMFGKEIDAATGSDRVGITLSGVVKYKTREEMKPFVGNSAFAAVDSIFAPLSTALSITCDHDYVAKAAGNPVALMFTVSGGDAVEKVVLEKLVDGKWEFLENAQKKSDNTYTALGRNLTTSGEKVVYRAVVTDKKGTVAISNEVTVETLNFRFVSMPEETVTAKSGTTLTLSVKAEGGKEPYTYIWYEWQQKANGFSLFPLYGYNTSTVLYEGAKNDTLTFNVQSYLVNNSQKGIVCKVTDAEGNEIKTHIIFIEN